MRSSSSRSFATRARCSSSARLADARPRSAILASISAMQLLLALRDPLQLGRQALLEAASTSAPQSAKRCSTDALGLGERGAELRRRVALALGDVAAALLGDAALLLGERRQRPATGRARASARARPRARSASCATPRRSAPCRARSPRRASRGARACGASATKVAAAARAGDERRRRSRRWRRRSRV